MDEYPRIAIDLGSFSVKVVVGQPEGENIRILGCGQAFHDGARLGKISSLEEVCGALNTAIEEAEAMSGRPVERVYTALGGELVNGMPTTAGIQVMSRDQKVTHDDVDRVLKRCTEVEVPRHIRPMDVVPCRYSLDGQPGLVDPVGMIGCELEAHAFVIYTNIQHADSIIHAINHASVEVLGLTHEALAASEAVLSRDERELGCLLIDIGHESSEWMLWYENILRATGSILIGGRRFSSDLATVLKTTTSGADRLKKIVSANPEEEGLEFQAFEVPEISGGGDKIVEGIRVSQILSQRAQELFREIADEICRLDLERYLGAGVVLTGGGSRMKGLEVVAERVFAQDTRGAGPRGFIGETEPVSSPEWSVGCGLIRWACRPDGHLFDEGREQHDFIDVFKDFLKKVFD